MKESEPMLETRLYRCGWIFLFILCVLEIAKKVLFPHFVLSFGTQSVCILYADGLFLPGNAVEPEVFGHCFPGKFSCVRWNFPMIFYAADRICLVYDQPEIDRISGHRLPIGMKYRETWVYASLVIVVIHFVVKNLFI